MPKVLDPFAGGGAIPLEALRLGCEAHAIDINPVAYLIELCTLVYPQKYGQPNSRPTPDYIKNLEAAHEGIDGDGLFSKKGGKDKASGAAEIDGIALTRLPFITEAKYQKNPLAADVKFWGHWVLEKAREEIGQFYPTNDDGTLCGLYLWARTVKCLNPACGASVPLVRQLWLCKRPSRKVAMRIVPDREKKRSSFEVVEGKGIKFDPATGTMQRGNATCPSCEQISDSSHLKAEGCAGRMKQQLMAVMSVNSGRSGKSYRPAHPRDIDCFGKAKAALERLRQTADEELIPTELIPAEDSRAIFVHLYGLRRWGDLFNDRQALALTTFLHKARRVAEFLGGCHEDDYRKAVASALGILVDRLASFNNSLVRWANHRETAIPPFSNNGFPMGWDYGETNPFSGSTGDWASSIEWVTRVIEANAFAPNPGVVRHASATRQPFSDSAFAAVVTDPPYYDAVPYADLSDFFYVWLRRTVGHLFPDVFRTPLTPKAQELIAYRSPGRRDNQKTEAWYEEGMGQAFAEMHRVIGEGGVCCVMFAHKTTSAWESIIAALIRAGLCVTSSWPFHTEMKTDDSSRFCRTRQQRYTCLPQAPRNGR